MSLTTELISTVTLGNLLQATDAVPSRHYPNIHSVSHLLGATRCCSVVASDWPRWRLIFCRRGDLVPWWHQTGLGGVCLSSGYPIRVRVPGLTLAVGYAMLFRNAIIQASLTTKGVESHGRLAPISSPLLLEPQFQHFDLHMRALGPRSTASPICRPSGSYLTSPDSTSSIHIWRGGARHQICMQAMLLE